MVLFIETAVYNVNHIFSLSVASGANFVVLIANTLSKAVSISRNTPNTDPAFVTLLKAVSLKGTFRFDTSVC